MKVTKKIKNKNTGRVVTLVKNKIKIGSPKRIA